MIAEKDFAGRQSRGARKYQEDAYAFSDITGKDDRVEGLLVVVADGMGGHTSGDEASEMALESFIDEFHSTAGTVRERLKAAVLAANDAITQELKRDAAQEGMGTTLLAAAITGAGLQWVSVGDSPLFLWRGGTLTRLNEDHSFRPVLHEMVEAGELTHADIARHPMRNLLRAALTGKVIELIDETVEPVALQEGDLILAASDGVQTLDNAAIAATLKRSKQTHAAGLASELLQAVIAHDHPKQDNITIAMIRAEAGGFIAHAPPVEETKPSTKDTETVIMNPLQEPTE